MNTRTRRGLRSRGALLLLGSVVLVLLAMVVVSPGAVSSQIISPVEVVRVPFPEDDGNLDPYSFEIGYPLMTLVYDTLMWRDADGVPQPWLADSVHTSADRRTVTVRLRRGVEWHDGKPLTADDVAFTFGYVAERYHPRFTPQLGAVEDVAARRRLTVVISLRHPAPGFLQQPLSDLPILPKHVWSHLPDDGPQGLPVGSGPYRLVAHGVGRSYDFIANDDYFMGKPSARALEIPILSSFERTLERLRDNRIDAIPASVPRVAAERLAGAGTTIARGDLYLGTALLFNLRTPPFDDVVLRRAVASAIDISASSRSVGGAVPARYGFLHPRSEWAPGTILHRYDPESASAIIGRLDPPPVTVLAPESDPVRLEVGRRIASDLERAGMSAKLRAVPAKEVAAAVGERGGMPTFQAAIWNIPALASYDPDFLAHMFGSGAHDAPFNYTGFESEVFDALARRVASSARREDRARAVASELSLLADEVPAVPILFPEGAFPYRSQAYDGWVFVAGSGILDKTSFLTTDEDAQRPGSLGSVVPDGDDRGARGFLKPLGLGLVGLAVLLATGALVFRR